VTVAFLELALRSSVRTHSLGIEPPVLTDQSLVALGAKHFERGCATCHGSPVQDINLPYEKMLPPPPPLAEAAGKWSDAELFWIVRNGLKYTGMPAWPAYERPDEVWPVVAFLKRYKEISPAEYQRLTRLTSRAVEIADTASGAALCADCHGDEATPPASRLVPVLDGQPRRYIEAALTHYATGNRLSGIMQPVAARLDTTEIARFAEHYSTTVSERSPPTPAPESAAERIEEGRIIATEGVRSEGIPACVACHSERSHELFPRLEGQSARYMIGQLMLWKSGLRRQTALGAIMSPIALRLSDEQIAGVAAYFETRATVRPAPGSHAR
jgi:cytochrome c553